MGVMEKIKEIEAEMARTQKNKATNYHLGTLKAKLARLRNELFVEQSSNGGGSSGGEGFDVARNGDARVALIGFPSVGKSSLLGALTSTESEAAAYEVHKSHEFPRAIGLLSSTPEFSHYSSRFLLSSSLLR